jgi:PEP-CTERM motif
MLKRLALIIAILFVPALAKADSFGNFTFQNGRFSSIDNVPSTDTPVGIDNAGDVLMAENNGTVIVNGNTVTSLNIPGEITVLPLAISPDGTVLGRAINFTSTYFTQSHGTVTFYPTTPGFLTGLNDNSQFVGTSFDGQTNFIYDSKTGAITNVANSAYLVTINDQGTVLGRSAGPTRNSFLYNAGVFTTLALPTGCVATAMNDNGTTVGDCLNGSGFVDQNGTISYLDYSAPNNGDKFDTFLTGINDSGEIVGSFANVPEPGSLLLLGAGITALALAVSLKNNLT